MNKYGYKTYLSIHMSCLLYLKSKKKNHFFSPRQIRWFVFDPIRLKGLGHFRYFDFLEKK